MQQKRRAPRCLRRNSRNHGWHTAPVVLLAVIALLLAPGRPASAFKWSSCPTPPLPVYPSDLGATSAPFIHPGHPLTIILDDEEEAETGGFELTTTYDVAITFVSLFGPPIALSARNATATSQSVLIFDFPDTQAEGLGVLAGPVDVNVTVRGKQVAHISAADLVALPPPTDVTSIVLGGSPAVTVFATLGADGDLWLPASFRGHPMAMPGCPGDFIMAAQIMIGGATVDGPLLSNFNPLDRIRGLDAYLADMQIGGLNFYGLPSQLPINLVHMNGTLGVSLCRLNDAIDTVLRVKGNQSWANAQTSPFRVVAGASHPIPLHLNGAPINPGNQSGPDSLGNACVPGARR